MVEQTIRDDHSGSSSIVSLVERLAGEGASVPTILRATRAAEERQLAAANHRAKAAERKRRERARKRERLAADVSAGYVIIPATKRDSHAFPNFSYARIPTKSAFSTSPSSDAARDPTVCPCCGADIDIPPPDVVIDVCRLPPQQAAILRTAWSGKGHPVPTIRFLDAMYADDPTGGPGEGTARRYFRTQLCLLRGKIAPMGMRIEALGYGRGYRLQLDHATPKTSKR